MQGIGADHAGLLEERLHRRVAGGERRRVAGGSATASRRAPRFDGNDRFTPCDVRRETGKPAGIAKAFEVQHDDVCVWIVGPIGQHIITGHIRPVTYRYKRRQAHVEALDIVQHGEAERTALRQHANVAGRRQDRGGKCRIERDLGSGIEEAHAVGPHQTHAGGAYQGTQTLLRLTPRG